MRLRGLPSRSESDSVCARWPLRVRSDAAAAEVRRTVFRKNDLKLQCSESALTRAACPENKAAQSEITAPCLADRLPQRQGRGPVRPPAVPVCREEQVGFCVPEGTLCSSLRS